MTRRGTATGGFGKTAMNGSRIPSRTGVSGLILLSLWGVACAAPPPRMAHEWPMVAGNPGWTSFSPDEGVKPPFRLRWVVKTDSCLKSGAVVAGGRVFLKSFQGPLLCFDAETGAVLWQREHNLGFYKNTPPSSDGKRVFIRDRSLDLLALAADSGALLWKTASGCCSSSRPSPAFADGVVFRGIRDSTSSYLCALRAQDGKEVWKSPVGRAKSRLSAPILVGDLVLCTSSGPSAAFAVDRRTGKEVWRTEGVETTQALSSDGVRAWAASPSEGVIALDVKSGKELWRWGGVKGQGVFVKAGTAAWAPSIAYGYI
jgi:outer membrane protein assembly factor BamB